MLRKTLMTGLLTSAVALTGGQALAASAELKDGTPVTVTGTVVELDREEFLLDYGQNRRIEVDMQDWGNERANVMIQPGSQITVSGRIDDDFMEAPEIDADALYVHNTDTHYTLGSVSQEQGYAEERVVTRRTAMADQSVYDEGVPAEQRLAPIDYDQLQTPTADQEQVIYSERTVTETYSPVTTAKRDVIGSDNMLETGPTITGRVTGIHGRKMQVMSRDGMVGVDTGLLPRDPSGGNVFPSIEEGDIVSFVGESSSDGDMLQVRRIVTVEKPNAETYTGQIIAPNTNPETTYQ